jgi:hypothetical protein
MDKEWAKTQATHMPNIITFPTEASVGYWLKLGYRRLLISVTDADTGEYVTRKQTYRKPEDFERLTNDLTSLAMLPDELLELLPFQFLESDGTVIKDTTTQKVVKRQILGGRRKQGNISSKTDEKYKRIARDFHKSGLSQREFCKETGENRSTLTRALRYCAKNVSNKGW